MRITRLTMAVMATAAGLLAVVAGPVAPTQAIVGGTTVPNGAYPFMASVQDGDFHFCGGTVIASTWVLTAAHCVSDANTSGLSVVVGTNNNSNGSGTRINVTQVIVHPQFDDLYHDAALLKLANATTVSPITLSNSPANDNLEAQGTPVTVAGWGDIAPTLGLLAGPSLKEAVLNVVSDSNCYGSTTSRAAITTVCAEALLKDSCYGDSGGPLFWKSGAERIQIGIVSHGLLCAIPLFAGAYSEVNNASIRSFITTHTGV